MLQGPVKTPRRVLMTVDAVGGIWRYGVELARGLNARGIGVVMVGLGPAPNPAQVAEADELPATVLEWLDAPLDWLAESETNLSALPRLLRDLAEHNGADLFHLNLPSQAADLRTDRPVVVAAHSCVPTWWAAVKGGRLPDAWCWQAVMNRCGLANADLVIAPSRSHAAALGRVYGPIDRLHVVANGAPEPARPAEKQPFALAAARWWDEGKNARILDAAAIAMGLPLVMAGATSGPNGQTAEIRNAEAPGELLPPALKALMARAVVFVSPSFYEPFGLAALEAGLAECALVLSDIPTYSEVWEGAALFVDPRDPAAFAHAVRRFARDEDFRLEYAGRARRRAQKFTLARQLDSLLVAYARAMSGAEAAPVRAELARPSTSGLEPRETVP